MGIRLLLGFEDGSAETDGSPVIVGTLDYSIDGADKADGPGLPDGIMDGATDVSQVSSTFARRCCILG